MAHARIPDPADPDEVGAAEFDTRRRGFDPVQVRAYLKVVARELARLRAREVELTSELAAARLMPVEPVVVEVEVPVEVPVEVLVPAPPEPVELDEALAVQLLGAETTRVLATARNAAAEIVARAEEQAAAILARAAAHEADTAARAQRAAEEELAAAEAEANARIAEARLVRERMLEELALRRHALRDQLEQMRAGRDRLARSYTDIRRALDEVSATLDEALPEAQRAARRAAARHDALPVPDATSIEREIDEAARAGTPIVTRDEIAAATEGAATAEDDEAPAWVNTGVARPAGEESPAATTGEVDVVAALDDEPSPPVAGATAPAHDAAVTSVAAESVEHPHEIVLAEITRSRRDAGLPRVGVPVVDPPDEVEAVRVLLPDRPASAPEPTGDRPAPSSADGVEAVDAAEESPAANAEGSVEEAGDTGALDEPATAGVAAPDEPPAPEAPPVQRVSPRVAEVAPIRSDDIVETTVTDASVLVDEPPAPDGSSTDATAPDVVPGAARDLSEHELFPAPAAEEPSGSEDRPAEPSAVEEPAVEAPVVAEPPVDDRPAGQEPGVEELGVEDRPAAQEPAAEELPATAEPPGAAQVDDLFDRIRRTRKAKVARAHEVLRESLFEPIPEDSPAAAAARPTDRPAGTPEPALDLVIEPEVVIAEDRAGAARAGDAALFAERDRVLLPLHAQVVRKLKRLLADEQNDVLDLVRRSRGKVGREDVLPEEVDHAGRYVAAIGGELLAAVSSGVSFFPSSASAGADADVASLDHRVGDEVVRPLRLLLERAIEVSEGSEDELLEHVRSAYREVRNQHVDEAARAVTSAAFNAGVESAHAGGLVRWAVDPVHGCSPDCDDNALEGAIEAGTAFPTGATRPPGHRGCRCLLVPADR